MKANQINDLSQSIDNYINYWRKTLEEVGFILKSFSPVNCAFDIWSEEPDWYIFS